RGEPRLGEPDEPRVEQLRRAPEHLDRLAHLGEELHTATRRRTFRAGGALPAGGSALTWKSTYVPSARSAKRVPSTRAVSWQKYSPPRYAPQPSTMMKPYLLSMRLCFTTPMSVVSVGAYVAGSPFPPPWPGAAATPVHPAASRCLANSSRHAGQ